MKEKFHFYFFALCLRWTHHTEEFEYCVGGFELFDPHFAQLLKFQKSKDFSLPVSLYTLRLRECFQESDDDKIELWIEFHTINRCSEEGDRFYYHLDTSRLKEGTLFLFS